MTRTIWIEGGKIMARVDGSKYPIEVPQVVMDGGAVAVDRYIDSEMERLAESRLREGRHDAYRK